MTKIFSPIFSFNIFMKAIVAIKEDKPDSTPLMFTRMFEALLEAGPQTLAHSFAAIYR